MLSSVVEGGGSLGSGTGYRITAPESGKAATSVSPTKLGKKLGDKKEGKERKLTSDYKVTASTSQPNAMDTLRPTAGQCGESVESLCSVYSCSNDPPPACML